MFYLKMYFIAVTIIKKEENENESEGVISP